MKEAIANANVFNLMIVFIVILMAFFVGSLGYSKAFKVKDFIINEIEREEEYDDKTMSENIDKTLSDIGYRVSKSNTNRCNDVMNAEFGSSNSRVTVANTSSKYEYCVFKIVDDNGARSSYRYRVIAYMYFDIPIINNLLKIPVKGETISFKTINS